MATTTANYGWRLPDANDFVTVAADISATVEDIDTEVDRIDDIAKPLGATSVTYVPVWSALSGSAPAIGNGTLVGKYTKTGLWVEGFIFQKMGSTTTFGDADNNSYQWTLPFPAANLTAFVGGVAENLWVNNAYAFDPGVANRTAQTLIKSEGTVLTVVNDGQGFVWSRNLPQVWANGDFLTLCFRYMAAA